MGENYILRRELDAQEHNIEYLIGRGCTNVDIPHYSNHGKCFVYIPTDRVCGVISSVSCLS